MNTNNREHTSQALHEAMQSPVARRLVRWLSWGAVFGAIYAVQHIRQRGLPQPSAIRAQISAKWRGFKSKVQALLHPPHTPPESGTSPSEQGG